MTGADFCRIWEQVKGSFPDMCLFGTEPGQATAVAFMTDTDNTGSSATAWYGDITLAAKPFSREQLGIKLREVLDGRKV
jgi:hypothetical protein